MELFFDILDRFNNATPIEDPGGWDSTALTLQRDREKHGVFPAFQNNTYEYTGIAARLLRAEYELYGVEGNMTLRITYDCGAGLDTLHIGRFSFAQWNDEFGDDCSVKLPVETSSDIMTFRNRIDQKVNLEAYLAFDGITTMPVYDALPFTANLPAKSIFVQDYALNDADVTTPWMGNWVSSGGAQGQPQMAFFVPEYTKTIAGEIGGFVVPSEATETMDTPMLFSWTPPIGWEELPYFDPGFTPFDQFFPFDALTPIVNYDAEMGQIFGNLPVSLTLDGKYDKTVSPVSALGTLTTNGIRTWNVYLGILRGEPSDPNNWQWVSNAFTSSTWSIWDDRLNPVTTPLRGTFTFSLPVTIAPGDRIYYFEKLFYEKINAYATSAAAFDITSHAGSYFRLHGLSYIPDTEARLFAVNESISRITEAITDDKLRLYSEFYGRTDSEPYSVSSDGCGSLHAITPGLFVRQMEQKLTDRPPIFSLSINDVWAGLNPIHNLGMGIEPDPFRSGYNCLRIENWRHFYSDDVVLECIGVNHIKRAVRATDHVSIFKFGYGKWEAEEYNGIDEYMTQREYRTELTQVNNTVAKISQFIASPFAIEVTRRKGNTTSEDWRYDNDTFVFCLKRDGVDLVIEQGDISDAANIIDPATIYNFRDRPAVMAMRWLPIILASYKQAGFSSKIIFTDGDGNVYAEGQLNSSFCKDEAGVTAENQTITPMNTSAPAEALPIWELEDVSFEYPMTIAQWKILSANSTGKIYYEGDGKSGHGWIDTVTYKPDSGIAEFSLIPAR